MEISQLIRLKIAKIIGFSRKIIQCYQPLVIETKFAVIKADFCLSRKVQLISVHDGNKNGTYLSRKTYTCVLYFLSPRRSLDV